MRRELRFTPAAREALVALEVDRSKVALFRQVRKTLGLLETNLRHPSLQTHRFRSLRAPDGGDVFEAYVQQHTPAAFRVFFCYGPRSHGGPAPYCGPYHRGDHASSMTPASHTLGTLLVLHGA
jgi:hypothetical protein